MLLPFYAAWLPDRDVLLLMGSGDGKPNFIGEPQNAHQPDFDASGLRHRYWTLSGDSIIQRKADSPLHYEIFREDENTGMQLDLDLGMTEDKVLLLVLHVDRRVNHRGPRFNFVVDDQAWSDVSELHGYAREALRLKQHRCVEKIWRCPITASDRGVRLGQARLLWPYGGPRIVDIHPPKPTRGLSSQIALTTRYDTYEMKGTAEGVILRLSPVDEGFVILLAWRSVFSGRSKAQASSSFMQAFHDNLRRFKGSSIALTKNQTLPGAARRPITRGVLSMRSDIQPSQLKPGQHIDWEFTGPLDLDDVLAVFVVAPPGWPVNVASGQNRSFESHQFEVGRFQVKARCWRAELERLAPIAWDDMEEDVRTSLKDQLVDELRTMPTAGKPAAVESTSGGRGGEAATASAVSGDLVAEAIAAVPHPAALQLRSLFAVDETLDGATEEWLATLPPETVRRLYAMRGAKPRRITNIARFLPVNVSAMLADPSLWTSVERDASALYECITEFRRIMEPDAAAPAGNLRRWVSGALRDLIELDFDLGAAAGVNVGDVAEAFAPTQLRAFPPLDPAILRPAGTILSEWAQKLKQISREVDNGNVAQLPAKLGS